MISDIVSMLRCISNNNLQFVNVWNFALEFNIIFIHIYLVHTSYYISVLFMHLRLLLYVICIHLLYIFGGPCI